jgi:glutathione S-transferase
MPLPVLPCGTPIPESDTISRFVLDEYKNDGPSFDPGSPLLRAKSDLAARILDIYITPNQGCLYKEMPAEERAKGIKEIAFQLDAIEDILDADSGARVCGDKQSLADSALFPTLCFLVDLLPAVYGWELDAGVFKNRPKLRAHWLEMSERDEVGKKVVAEMREGLEGWMDGGRFETLGITAQVKADPKAFIF